MKCETLRSIGALMWFALYPVRGYSPSLHTLEWHVASIAKALHSIPLEDVTMSMLCP